MPITKLDQLLDAVKSKPRRRLVAAFANDSHTIEAVNEAREKRIIDATLVGDEAVIRKILEEHRLDAADFEIIHEPVDSKAAAKAVELVRSGHGQILMKGLVSTDKYMKAILNKEQGLMGPGAVLSHVTVSENPNYPKLIVSSDAAVLTYPDLKQKVAITNYVIQVVQSLGIEKPRIALICATEQVSDKIPATLDAAVIAKMAERGPDQGRLRGRTHGPGRGRGHGMRAHQGRAGRGRRERRRPGLAQHRRGQRLLQDQHQALRRRAGRHGGGRQRPLRPFLPRRQQPHQALLHRPGGPEREVGASWMLPLPIRFAGSYSFDGRKDHPSSGITLDEDLIVVGNPATLDIRIDLGNVTVLQPFVRCPFFRWGLRIEHLDATVPLAPLPPAARLPAPLERHRGPGRPPWPVPRQGGPDHLEIHDPPLAYEALKGVATVKADLSSSGSTRGRPNPSNLERLAGASRGEQPRHGRPTDPPWKGSPSF